MFDTLRQILGLEDFGAALAMLWAAQKITTKAGFRTQEELWAAIRRIVYFLMTLALAVLGIGRFDGWYPIEQISQFIMQSVLLCGIIFFPLMRALGFVTQDLLIDRGRRTYGSFNGH